MAVIDIQDYALLNGPLTTRHFVGALYGGEYQAHRFLIRAVKDGAEQNLTGAVTARFLRKADDPVSEVVMNGEIIGGKASVTLPQSCYAIPGRFEMTIFLTQNGSKTALYNCAGIVRNTSASPIIDPGQIVPDVDDILAQYQTMVDATENADAAAQSATYVSNYTRTLTPGNFTLTYDGYVMQAESAVTPGGDPAKAVMQENAAWGVYTYDIGYNALIRIDKLVKNSDVSGVIPMAIRRYTGKDQNDQDTYAYYSLDYDRTAQLFVGDQLMLNHVDPNGFALDYIGVTMITNYNFNDIINCTEHIGEFDSVVVFGDSIFAGYMPWDDTLGESHIGRGVTQQVADMLGLPMTNYAVPGAYLTTKDTTFKPVIQQVVEWTPTPGKTPLILIDGGTNDRYNNELTNFGEYSGRELDTIYGSLLSIVEWLFTKEIQPWQIVFTTPIPNAIRAINVGDQITFLEHIDTQLAAISFAYHMIGSAMGVNVINGWHGPFSNLGNEYPKAILLPDDVHPSVQGAAYYADYICRTLGGKSTKINERLAYSAAQPFVKGNVAEDGRVFLALSQEDFTPYHLGAVLTANGDTVAETANSEWDIYSYKYFMNQNFQLRMDSLSLNPAVANVLDSGDEGYIANFQHVAYQRIYHNVDLDQYQTTNYPIGTSDAGKTVETCAILVNRRRRDGALAIKDIGITVNARRDFEDMVVCQDHMGEFDSVVVFGDSIFANHLSNAQGQEIDGHLTNSGVMDRFAALMNLPQENHALGGASLSAMQSSPASVWHQVQAWEGPETGSTPLIMINGGTNDQRLYQLCNMGSYSHIDPIEIYGGLCEIIENIEGTGIQPWQIVVNTPIPKGYFADVYNLTLTDAQLTAIGYAMYEVCLKYGVSVINGYRGPFSNIDSTALKMKLMPDDTHPSVYGATLYAERMFRLIGAANVREVADLKSVLSVDNEFFTGQGNTLAKQYYENVKKGHTYRAYILSWDISGVTSGNDFHKFQIGYVSNGVETRLYALYMNQSFPEYFEVTIPSNAVSEKLFIGGRVTSGREGIVYLEDITESISITEQFQNVNDRISGVDKKITYVDNDLNVFSKNVSESLFSTNVVVDRNATTDGAYFTDRIYIITDQITKVGFKKITFYCTNNSCRLHLIEKIGNVYKIIKTIEKTSQDGAVTYENIYVGENTQIGFSGCALKYRPDYDLGFNALVTLVANIDETTGVIDVSSATETTLKPNMTIITYDKTCVDPDDYTGTDAEKIQAAFDDLVNGGMMIIKRQYTISDDILIRNIYSQYHLVYVIGANNNAGFYFGTYGKMIRGTASNTGGIRFMNLKFSGISTAMIMRAGSEEDHSALCGIYFENCVISDVAYVCAGEHFLQSLTFKKCVIRNITQWVVANTNGSTILNIEDCIIEWCKGVWYANYPYACNIINNIIEGCTDVIINFRNNADGSVRIVGNYFESNNVYGELKGLSIDLDHMNDNRVRNITIENNYFSGIDCGIRLPANGLNSESDSLKCGITIMNNAFHCVPKTIDGQQVYDGHLIVGNSETVYNEVLCLSNTANSGDITNLPSSALKVLAPYDLAKVLNIQ